MPLAVTVSLIVFLVLLTLDMPVYRAVFAALFAAIFILKLSPDMVPSPAYYAVDSYMLIAAPLFMVMGGLMGVGGMSVRLVTLAMSLVGRIKGGLAHVLVLACLFFGTITGSSLVTTVTMGSIMIPRMGEYGWDRRYAAALTACAAPLGYLIPPSTMGIMYAYISGVSVGRIFISTVVPGFIMALLLMIVNYTWGMKWYRPVPLPAGEKRPPMVKEVGRALLLAWPAALAPLVVLGGIYGGIFTVTEASAIGVVYALLVGFLVYRELKWKTVFQNVMGTASTTATIFIIIVVMAPWVKSLVLVGFADALTGFVTGFSTNVYVILLMLNILLLILGMFIEPIPILLAIVPLLLPIFKATGIDLIHVGTVILINMGIGAVTPPFAINLMAAGRVGKVAYHELWGPGIAIFLMAMLPTLLITTYVPQLSLWLPNLIMGPE